MSSYDNQIWYMDSFRKAQVCAKFHCPALTVTLFYEDGEEKIHFSPVIESQTRPANSGGTIVHNYPCCVRRLCWMPRGLLFLRNSLPLLCKEVASSNSDI